MNERRPARSDVARGGHAREGARRGEGRIRILVPGQRPTPPPGRDNPSGSDDDLSRPASWHRAADPRELLGWCVRADDRESGCEGAGHIERGRRRGRTAIPMATCCRSSCTSRHCAHPPRGIRRSGGCGGRLR